MKLTAKYLFQLIWVCILLYWVYLMVELSLPYTAFKPGVDFLITKQLTYQINYWRVAFYLHVFVSVFALIAGFTQFNKFILHKKKKLHIYLGLLYWLAVLFVAAPTGFIMGIHANGGLPAKTSFVLLSLLWFMFTLLAVIAIQRKQFNSHAAWMIRSYALTLSAITLRLYALLFDVFHIHVRPQEVYITIAWLSWVPNLIIAEIIINRGFVKKLLN